MAVSFFQKIKLALRGWSRRRDEREQEFLRKNMKWAPAPVPEEPPPAPPPPFATDRAVKHADLEGLQAAYLDASGLIAYYLDLDSGEVVESRDGVKPDSARYKRVPVRMSEDDDRRAFIETLERNATRMALMKNVGSATWRSVLAGDRAVERAWFNFRNERATAVIEEWLKQVGSR